VSRVITTVAPAPPPRSVYQVPLLHIAGRWRAGKHAHRPTLVDPASGARLGELSLASAEDIDEALAAADRGFAAGARCRPSSAARP